MASRGGLYAFIHNRETGKPLAHWRQAKTKNSASWVAAEAGEPILLKLHITSDFDWHDANALRVELYLDSPAQLPLVDLPILRKPNVECFSVAIDRWPVWEASQLRWMQASFNFVRFEDKDPTTMVGEPRRERSGQIRIAVTRIRIFKFDRKVVDSRDLGEPIELRTMNRCSTQNRDDYIRSQDLTVDIHSLEPLTLKGRLASKDHFKYCGQGRGNRVFLTFNCRTTDFFEAHSEDHDQEGGVDWVRVPDNKHVRSGEVEPPLFAFEEQFTTMTASKPRELYPIGERRARVHIQEEIAVHKRSIVSAGKRVIEARKAKEHPKEPISIGNADGDVQYVKTVKLSDNSGTGSGVRSKSKQSYIDLTEETVKNEGFGTSPQGMKREQSLDDNLSSEGPNTKKRLRREIRDLQMQNRMDERELQRRRKLAELEEMRGRVAWEQKRKTAVMEEHSKHPIEQQLRVINIPRETNQGPRKNQQTQKAAAGEA